MMRQLLLLSILFVVATAATAANLVPDPPVLKAKAYILMDAANGEVLAEHNADMPLPPASLTKMMTSYILAREIDEGNVQETDMVTISENAWSQNPKIAAWLSQSRLDPVGSTIAKLMAEGSPKLAVLGEFQAAIPQGIAGFQRLAEGTKAEQFERAVSSE